MGWRRGGGGWDSSLLLLISHSWSSHSVSLPLSPLHPLSSILHLHLSMSPHLLSIPSLPSPSSSIQNSICSERGSFSHTHPVKQLLTTPVTQASKTRIGGQVRIPLSRSPLSSCRPTVFAHIHDPFHSQLSPFPYFQTNNGWGKRGNVSGGSEGRGEGRRREYDVGTRSHGKREGKSVDREWGEKRDPQ